MHFAKVLSFLALVSSTLAAPYAYYGHKQGNTVFKTIFRTAYVTKIVDGNQPSPSSALVPALEPTPVTSIEVVVAPNHTGYMATVNEYRVRLGLSTLAQDAKLEANALKTVMDGNGRMAHQLNPGSFGQVLAPGQFEDFHHVFVGGWLCERPDLKGLNGECSIASKGWMYSSTGHADILTSGGYKTIGCAWFNGIWGCDLAW